jgi:hypothetical protein
MRALLRRAKNTATATVRPAAMWLVWRPGQYVFPLGLALYVNRTHLADGPVTPASLPHTPWMADEQRALLARSEQRLQSIEGKGPGLATVCAVVVAAVAVAISLTWKDATTVARVSLVASGTYALLSLYAPIRLVGPVRRSAVTSEHLADAGTRSDGEQTLGRLYAEAAAANDHEVLRLSNLRPPRETTWLWPPCSSLSGAYSRSPAALDKPRPLDDMRLILRHELSAIWLPWCVARNDQTTIVKIDAGPERSSRAMQLRIADLGSDDIRRALSRQVVRDDGRSSIDLIAEHAQRFRAMHARGSDVAITPLGSIDDPAVFMTPEGPMLHEACHRVCGLYDAGLARFVLILRVDPLFGPWLVYETATLRERHERPLD